VIFGFCHHSWFSASSPWWASTQWWPPPIPLAVRGSLSGRLLPTPEWDGRDEQVAARMPQLSCWRASPNVLWV
jgi:hypothetical protein